MCTVQVLLFADGMGRPGESQGGVRAGVCRRLFAEDPSTDPSSLLRSMEEQLRNRDKERWNFDFQTGTPLPGRYQWVAVGKASHATKRTEERVVAEAVRPQTTKTSSTSVQASKGKKNRASSSTQSKITDFLTKRKRSSVPEDGASHKLKVRRLTNSSSSSRSAVRMPR